MTKDEALKIALDALQQIAHVSAMDYEYQQWAVEAITAIKEALANEALEKMAENARELGLDYEPEQEPVAWISPKELLVMRGNAYAGAKDWRVNLGLESEEGDIGLYTTPPQRTWVGLTDGEVDKMILLMGFPPDWITENAIVKNIVRNLEAKLKEKNSNL